MLDAGDEAHLSRLLGTQPGSAGELGAFLERLREGVVEVARRDERVEERLRDARHRTLTVDYREDKAPEGDPPSRLADAGFYDYDRDVLVVATVDLRSGGVVDVSEREGAAPPITHEELEEARDIAARRPGAAEVWADRRAPVVAFPTPSYAFAARPGSLRHRGCVLYAAGSRDEESWSVVVDLSAREVVPDDELPEILRSRRGGRAKRRRARR